MFFVKKMAETLTVHDFVILNKGVNILIVMAERFINKGFMILSYLIYSQ